MSFVFPSWSTAFSPAFHEDAKAMLEAALNKGNKPPVIQGRIEVVELSMGTQPPTLTLLEIGDLSLERFRGILRLGYQGDAWLEVRCRVQVGSSLRTIADNQANPLSHNPNLATSSTLPLSAPLLASQPFLVPMTLRLSLLHLRAILILVVSASKGITLVFKNDPLQNVDVSSTFDSVEVIRGYLQQEIEGQLREMFREDLPGIIHRLSQRWFHGTGVGGKVETPYKDGGGEYVASNMDTPSKLDDEAESTDAFGEKDMFPASTPSSSPAVLTPRKKASQKLQRSRRLSTAASDSPTSYTVFPDIEDYDPTYGLRPESLPHHSGYEAFGRLWEKAREGEGRGLGSLMSIGNQEEDRGDVSDGDWDEEDGSGNKSFDMVEMDESLQILPGRLSRRQSGRGSKYDDEDAVEWETFPAVGGGMITRPRVYHSQSQIRAPSEAGGGGAMPSPSGTGSVTARASSIGGASSTIGSLRQMPLPVGLYRAPTAGPGPSSLRRLATSRSDVFLSHKPSRSESFSVLPPTSHHIRSPISHTNSSNNQTSGSSWDTSKPSRSTAPSSRPVSIDASAKRHTRAASYAGTSLGSSFPPRSLGPGGILLPFNNSVSQLATLSHSNQTLSPYARGYDHIAVRSFPHLGKTTASQPPPDPASDEKVKARRKRIYRLGGAKDPDDKAEQAMLSPEADTPPSDPDASRRFSGSSEGKSWTPPSLVGQAHKVLRPTVRRGDSRTSYGFPSSASAYGSAFGRIQE